MHASAIQDLPGKPDQKQLRIASKWYALGLSTNRPERFQGFHAGSDVPDDPDADVRYQDEDKEREKALKEIKRLETERPEGGILFIFDEAAGIDQVIYNAAKGALTGPETYVLYIGNPDLDVATEHEFVRSHKDPDFLKIKCGAEPGPDDPFEADIVYSKVPNWLITDEWLEDRKSDYGVGTPLYYSKVWGMFAGGDASRRIMPHDLLLIAERTPCTVDLGVHLGVDVAREGGDMNVAALVVDGNVRGMHAWRTVLGDPSPLMSVVQTILALRLKWGDALDLGDVDEIIPWKNVHIDSIGIGAGVCDRLWQKGMRCERVDFSKKPDDDWRSVCGSIFFRNRRAELHWVVRRCAEEGLFSMSRDWAEAWQEAQWAEYEHRELAQGTTVYVNPKKDIKDNYGRSPDHWDAILLAYSRGNTGTLGFSVR
jgi:hypothetical protein